MSALPDERDDAAPAPGSSASILIVEDEASLADSVRYNLEREGFTVAVASDGRRAIDRFRAEHPSLVILDLMLPEISGLDVCRAIRAESDVPIIMVTAKDSEADKVAGLELGADDYVTKPFSVRELVSRVRAHLRRAGMRGEIGPAEDVLHGGPVEMDVGRHEVRVRGGDVAFPPKEFELLEAFLRRKDRLLTRTFLIEEVWGIDYVGDTKTLDVHVKRIRQKIEEDAHEPRHLLTVRGLGYKFVE
jgi:two-component system, OmpR family, response regulator RegX3